MEICPGCLLKINTVLNEPSARKCKEVTKQAIVTYRCIKYDYGVRQEMVLAIIN